MQNKKKALLLGAFSGLLAGSFALGALTSCKSTDDEMKTDEMQTEKNACSGKDGCSSKDSCSGKDGCSSKG